MREIKLTNSMSGKKEVFKPKVAGKVSIDTSAREIVQAGTGKQIVDMRPGQKTVKIAYQGVEEESVIYGKAGKLNVKDGAKVKMGQLLAIKSDGTELASPHDGVVKAEKPGIATVIFETEKIREYIIPPGFSLYAKDGDEVQAGDALTDGNLDLQVLFKTKGQDAVQKYLSKEIQFIYASQGQKVNNKHIEIIIRQMFSRVRVLDTGDTDLLPGEIIEKATYLDANDVVLKGGAPATCEPLFLGITKISLSTDSWLSSASFQETARVLINAAVTGKVDTLQGLKENVIIGRLIPAGTGFKDMGTELIGQMPVYDDEEVDEKVDVLDEEIKKAFEENRAIEVAAAKAEIAAAE